MGPLWNLGFFLGPNWLVSLTGFSCLIGLRRHYIMGQKALRKSFLGLRALTWPHSATRILMEPGLMHTHCSRFGSRKNALDWTLVQRNAIGHVVCVPELLQHTNCCRMLIVTEIFQSSENTFKGREFAPPLCTNVASPAPTAWRDVLLHF